MKKTPSKLPSIKSFTKYFSIKNLHTKNVICLKELSNNLIATGSWDGSISITSVNYTNKKWTRLIKKNDVCKRFFLFCL